ncbi:MAG: hypothetical protein MMC33_005244 [Icmadophila ericetorum]|nr:hypothetical protein [Icmadophila ericetorum]
MPLSFDEKVVKVSRDLVSALQSTGKHPGYRPAHARGILLSGTFTPSADAKLLTSAPHFSQTSTPILVRFSSSTGIPNIPDTDPNANPRGLAIRFQLSHGAHTDIITHSTPFFPTRTGAEFLEFLGAAGASGPGAASPSPIEKFLGTHPAALAFVQAPKPSPASFAKGAYFGVTALRFMNSDGSSAYFRYRVIPDGGVENLDGDALRGKSSDFLFDEIQERILKGPVTMTVVAQLAEKTDVVDDATVHWPESRPIVELGKIEIKAVEPNNAKEQKHIIFDPIPRVEGIAPSADPLLEVRASVYLISGRERRAAR